ncbi:MAG: hypothetical protein ACOZE7_18945 [Pseudomonadota bacterium]
MSALSKKRTHFLKASHPPNGRVKLDPVRVAHNWEHGIATSLLLDTNILIGMERIVAAGNKPSLLKQYGLENLIAFLHRCPQRSIYLSPAWGFNEMPPGLAGPCREAYEVFFAAHLPEFCDDPLSMDARYSGKTTDYGFFDLEEPAQAVLAVPFASLTYLQLVDREPGLSPLDRFDRYLKLITERVGIMSGKELQIARFCFANPPSTCRETIETRKVFRRNFVKRKDESLPRTASELLHVSFNGASDLSLLNCADLLDGRLEDGVPHECWIATTDEKLAKFTDHFHLVNYAGESTPFAALARHPEHDTDVYWKETAVQWRRYLTRENRLTSREPSMLCEIARRSANDAVDAFSS